MANQVLISKELFGELVKYHCLNISDDNTEQWIKDQLEDKLNKMCNREEYTKRIYNNETKIN